MENDIIPVTFADGVVVEQDNVKVFVAGDLQEGDFDVTRLFFLTNDGNWTYHDVSTVVASICVVREPALKYFALGRDGRLFWSETRKEWLEEEIPDAGTGPGKYGYLAKIREIAGELYACGHRGQVYHRTTGGWVHVDDGLLTEKHGHVTSHHAIDGTSHENIYVAGNNGRIFHYDGKQWTDVSPETNVDLLSLRCIDSETVYVGGDNGLLYRGNHERWQLLCEPTKHLSIWDLEEHKGILYLVLEDQLAVYEEESITPIEYKFVPPLNAYHLSQWNNVLWSFGEKDLAYFDGNNWNRVIHPHNQ